MVCRVCKRCSDECGNTPAQGGTSENGIITAHSSGILRRLRRLVAFAPWRVRSVESGVRMVFFRCASRGSVLVRTRPKASRAEKAADAPLLRAPTAERTVLHLSVQKVRLPQRVRQTKRTQKLRTRWEYCGGCAALWRSHSLRNARLANRFTPVGVKGSLFPTSAEIPPHKAGVLAHSLGIEPKSAAPEATVLSIILRVRIRIYYSASADRHSRRDKRGTCGARRSACVRGQIAAYRSS